MNELILGISTGFHDSSACLVDEKGNILFASSEERFSRIKGDSSFPHRSIQEAINITKDSGNNISTICIHENIFNRNKEKFTIKNFLRHPKSYFTKYKSIHNDLDEINSLCRKLELDKACVWFSQHHLSHAYASISVVMEEMDCPVLDAIGEKVLG